MLRTFLHLFTIYRAAFIRANDELGEIEAQVQHPANDMEGFTVRADFADNFFKRS